MALAEEERPLPNLTGVKRWFLGWVEFWVTLFVSLIPMWETDTYIKVVYHSWFKNSIKLAHPRPVEEEVEPTEGEQGEAAQNVEVNQN